VTYGKEVMRNNRCQRFAISETRERLLWLPICGFEGHIISSS
jgi:hypothetical protein